MMVLTKAFDPYQPFDLGSFLKVTGDQTNQNCNINQGHKSTVMTF